MAGVWAVEMAMKQRNPKHINELESPDLLAMAGILPGMQWSERWQRLGFSDPNTTWQDRTRCVMDLVGSCMDLTSAQEPRTGLDGLMQLHSLHRCVLLSKCKMADTGMFTLYKCGHRKRQQYAGVKLGIVVVQPHASAGTHRGAVTRPKRKQVILRVHRALALAQLGFPSINAQIAVHDPAFCISQHGWCLCSGHVRWADQSTNCMHRELTKACARVRGVQVKAAVHAWETACLAVDSDTDVHAEEDNIPSHAAVASDCQGAGSSAAHIAAAAAHAQVQAQAQPAADAAADVASLAQHLEKVRITKLPVARRMRMHQGGVTHQIVKGLALPPITRHYGILADAPKSPLRMLTRDRHKRGDFKPQDALKQPVAIVARSDMASAKARRELAAGRREQAREETAACSGGSSTA